ncbi:Bug family tripartite tricarboxylate transporter substrate binding protein [Pseudomonas chlororaphis]|uniref:Bug family tripartite tricarboxylate transporter substrate binding protein n=1 Tax=Pseudomonas chlororaphis TaxID=587753 RepID=UPI0004AFF495|nr:tripartite tricarboxylate transporter substrate binding protein [Pseudomonas chlororaphis]
MKASMRILAIAAGAMFSLAQVAGVQAQTDFPAKPITLVVPWNAGGAVDMTARRLAESLSKKGVRVVVENLAGASGTIGLNKVARAAPDGYTLGLATTSLMGAIAQKITPLTTADFTVLSQTTEEQEVLFVPKGSPVKSVEDLAALMKRTKGGLSIGTPGAYTVNHVYAAMLANAVGAPIVHVAYTGSAKVLVDLAGHQLDAGVLKPSEAQGQVQAGLVRPIGAFSTVRSEVFPQAPTFQERGLDVFPYGALPLISYVVAPSGLPPQIESRLIDLIGAAVNSREYQSFSKQYGMTGQNLKGKDLQAVVERIQATFDVVLPKLPQQ